MSIFGGSSNGSWLIQGTGRNRKVQDVLQLEKLRTSGQSAADRLQRQKEQQRIVWQENKAEALVIRLGFGVFGINEQTDAASGIEHFDELLHRRDQQ